MDEDRAAARLRAARVFLSAKARREARARPYAQRDAGPPDAQRDARRDTAQPDTQRNAAELGAQRDAAKPDTRRDAAEPDARRDAGQPDAQPNARHSAAKHEGPGGCISQGAQGAKNDEIPLGASAFSPEGIASWSR